MLNPSAWLAAYHQAWITHDAEQLAQLFTEDAAYHSHPFRPPYQGRAAIQAYWQSATASQADLELRWGAPVIADKHMAVEWWAMMRDTEAGVSRCRDVYWCVLRKTDCARSCASTGTSKWAVASFLPSNGEIE
ncbi:MAG TPA: nuclear transport factor 2 family protein [Ktedonobacterales bacterium]|nr:nuclear transport factor 2 family protein [Ktedonobacterales bacterium]